MISTAVTGQIDQFTIVYSSPPYYSSHLITVYLAETLIFGIQPISIESPSKKLGMIANYTSYHLQGASVCWFKDPRNLVVSPSHQPNGQAPCGNLAVINQSTIMTMSMFLASTN